MTTGTVTLSLADVDKLRDEIKEGKRIEEELKQELAEVKADKRVVKITKPVYTTSYPNVEINSHAVSSLLRTLGVNDWRLMDRSFGGNSHLNSLIKDCVKISTSYVQPEEEKTEYVNLSDVEIELKRKVEAEVAEEIGALRVSTRNSENKLAEEKANNALKIANLQKESEKIVNKVKEKSALVVEELQKEVVKWIKDYTDLKEDRDARTEAEKLMDKIKELEKALEKETAKKWWNKLY